MVNVRIVLAIATSKGCEQNQMDVYNVFLHGDLQEEEYMKLLPEFHSAQLGTVCKLRMSLYGLKQDPHCWFVKLSLAIKHYKFRQSDSYYSLFTLIDKDVQLVVLVYVDDLIICGNNSISNQRFKDYLSQCFI